MTNNTGGPAFPATQRANAVSMGKGEGANYEMEQSGGMTLRDYFAAKAMQSTLADDAYIEKTQTPAEWLEIVAKASYEIADAMIKARNQNA